LWIQDTFKDSPDRKGKPKEIVGSWADISEHKNIEASLRRLSEQVELRNQLISQAFNRYLTNEAVASALESPTEQELKEKNALSR
jgi:hypothetical protein